MNFGAIVKELRLGRGMTMTQLADGICSEKYIYLMEKNKRYPSIDIVDQLNRKFNYELYDYLLFKDFDNPILAFKIYHQLNNAKLAENMEALETLIRQNMDKLSDNEDQYLIHYFTSVLCMWKNDLKGAYIACQEAMLCIGISNNFYHSMTKVLSYFDIKCYLQYASILTARKEFEPSDLILQTISSYLNQSTVFGTLGALKLEAGLLYAECLIAQGKHEVAKEALMGLKDAIHYNSYLLYDRKIDNLFYRIHMERYLEREESKDNLNPDNHPMVDEVSAFHISKLNPLGDTIYHMDIDTKGIVHIHIRRLCEEMLELIALDLFLLLTAHMTIGQSIILLFNYKDIPDCKENQEVRETLLFHRYADKVARTFNTQIFVEVHDELRSNEQSEPEISDILFRSYINKTSVFLKVTSVKEAHQSIQALQV